MSPLTSEIAGPALGVAVVGVGRMGAVHARELTLGKVPRARLAAVCDPDPRALASFPEVPRFGDFSSLLGSGLADAVVIATPHYQHTPLAIEALAAGLHVLVEKPIAVHKADAERMLAAHAGRPKRGQVFAAMFNLRLDPRFLKLRELISSGALGPLRRIQWTLSDILRTNAYYRSAEWRATWRGEGGGVLQNQCPHALDLWQWLFGMPARVHAFCDFGRYHPIEVEDRVTAYLEYDDGLSGVFVATTGEAPGPSRLEVVGDWGTASVCGDELVQSRNPVSTADFVKSGPERGAPPPPTTTRFTLAEGGSRIAVIENFVKAVFDEERLIAPAVEGLASVELGNAMLYSALTRRTVELPLDAACYAAELGRLITGSQGASRY